MQKLFMYLQMNMKLTKWAIFFNNIKKQQCKETNHNQNYQNKKDNNSRVWFLNRKINRIILDKFLINYLNKKNKQTINKKQEIIIKLLSSSKTKSSN